MLKTLMTFVKDESGATAIEYGLIAALVAVGLIAALTALGDSLSTIFYTISSELDTASN
jgi:pilus assembly protein Flp/PilA